MPAHRLWMKSGASGRATDIDLPFVISKKKNLENLCYKNDFTNIILVFDYERHDPQFSADKILRLQNYFSDANFRLIA